MKKHIKLISKSTLMSILLALGLVVTVVFAAAVTTDDFNTCTTLLQVQSSIPTASIVSSSGCTGVLQGERDSILTFIAGGRTSLDIVGGGLGNAVELSQNTGSSASAEIQWDGTDGSTALDTTTGLGGVDLTAGGNDRFRIELVFDDIGVDFRITVYTNGINYSTFTFDSPGSASGFPDQVSIIIPYTDSGWVATGSGATFSSVNAITLHLLGSTAVGGDLALDFFETTGTAAEFGDLPTTGTATTGAGYGVSYTGANHIPQGLRLGNYVDSELSANSSASASGDDTTDSPDDEDGVQRDAAYLWANGNTVYLIVKVEGCVGTCYLNGWIDWDSDGDFTDADSQLFINRSISDGANQSISIVVPSFASSGYTTGDEIYARFRICDNSGDCDSPDNTDTAVKNGEIEDYYWSFGPTAVTLKELSADSGSANSGAIFATFIVLLVAALSLLTAARRPAAVEK